MKGTLSTDCLPGVETIVKARAYMLEHSAASFDKTPGFMLAISACKWINRSGESNDRLIVSRTRSRKRRDDNQTLTKKHSWACASISDSAIAQNSGVRSPVLITEGFD